MAEMTMRERMLAVVQGREHDRVPFVQYSNLAAPDDEIWPVIGRGNMGILRWAPTYRVEHPNCRFETIEDRPAFLKPVQCGLWSIFRSLQYLSQSIRNFVTSRRQFGAVFFVTRLQRVFFL